jgi:phosphate transport system permease protein
MSTPAPASRPPGPARRTGGSTSLLANGESMVWIMGGTLAVCAVMVVGLLALVVWQGGTTFWPRPVERIQMANATVLMGEVTRHDDSIRRLVRTGNFERTGTHFEWVSDDAIASESRPEWAVVLERRTWGRFYGVPAEFRVDGRVIASGPDAAWKEFEATHGSVADRFRRRYRLQRDDFGALNAHAERGRLATVRAEREHGVDSPEYKKAAAIHKGEEAAMAAERRALEDEIRSLDQENARYE